MTTEQIAAMAPIALTYSGSDVVNVRMQTEHLHAVERDLAQRGVGSDLVSEHFADLHRCPPLPLGNWLGAVIEAYNNQAIAAASAR